MLANDPDVDIPKSLHAQEALGRNGHFKYKADNGTWSRDPSVTMSGISNEATVNIVVKKK